MAEEGTGGCLCMFSLSTSPKYRAIKMEKKKRKKFRIEFCVRPSKINNMLIVPALTDFWCLANFFVICYFYKKSRKQRNKNN